MMINAFVTGYKPELVSSFLYLESKSDILYLDECCDFGYSKISSKGGQ